jgi:hypothetical protein
MLIAVGEGLRRFVRIFSTPQYRISATFKLVFRNRIKRRDGRFCIRTDQAECLG